MEPFLFPSRYQEKFGVKDIMHDLEILKSKIERGKIQRGLILNNEKANHEYTTQFLSRLYYYPQHRFVLESFASITWHSGRNLSKWRKIFHSLRAIIPKSDAVKASKFMFETSLLNALTLKKLMKSTTIKF